MASDTAASGYVVRRHRCTLPLAEGAGDIWRCECGRPWRSVHPGNPDYAGWRRVGPIRRRLYGLR